MQPGSRRPASRVPGYARTSRATLPPIRSQRGLMGVPRHSHRLVDRRFWRPVVVFPAKAESPIVLILARGRLADRRIPSTHRDARPALPSSRCSGVSMLDKKTQVGRGGARPGSGRRKQWTDEKLWQLLFDFEAQRRSARVKLSDSQLCVRLAEKFDYRRLSAGTIRRKLQDARIGRIRGLHRCYQPLWGKYTAPTSIVALVNMVWLDSSESPQGLRG
jgi:hypothetical protein